MTPRNKKYVPITMDGYSWNDCPIIYYLNKPDNKIDEYTKKEIDYRLNSRGELLIRRTDSEDMDILTTYAAQSQIYGNRGQALAALKIYCLECIEFLKKRIDSDNREISKCQRRIEAILQETAPYVKVSFAPLVNCDFCAGAGEVACSSTHYEKCPKCGGAGRVEKPPEKLGGVRF